MTRYLTIHVHSHEGRYHGDGDEMPSPFRLFQALVAGAGISGPLDDQTKEALAWLEGLRGAPLIACPRMVRGQSVTMFMPNNDLDKFGGDVRNIAKTRLAQKVWRPRHFDASVPWIYAWPFADDDESNAGAICALSEKLYQLGRGIDMAWAWGELLDEPELEAQLTVYEGMVRRPSVGGGLMVACPTVGSLGSLERRYRARRFRYEGGERVFVQQPKPSYRQIAYESPPVRYLFELRSSTDSERRVAWPIEGALSLVTAARDAARARLSSAMPDRTIEINQLLLGRERNGSNTVPSASRVRIIPIPSIGMHYADRGIRRLLIEVPNECSLHSADVRWAFSGAELIDVDTSEVKDILLSPSSDDDMLKRYGIGSVARVFRSVTPVALPEDAKRRRIEPTRKHAEAKRGLERVVEVSGAGTAVKQALRHAGVRASLSSIRVQREPFEGAGSRVELFADGNRFEKERLWHVELSFGKPIEGPILIGDGRFLGLGLMAPVVDVVPSAHAFAIVDRTVALADALAVARALRRAVMARVQVACNGHALDPFFSGHENDGAPIRRTHSSHLSFAIDPSSRLALVLAPHLVERRAATPQELDQLRKLDVALEGFRELRAGKAGLLELSPVAIEEADLLGRSRIWETVTSYVVTRHAKASTATGALAEDVLTECRRLALPSPKVESSGIRGVPGIGLTADVRLTFEQSFAGPIMLGRTRYVGGGFFRPVKAQ